MADRTQDMMFESDDALEKAPFLQDGIEDIGPNPGTAESNRRPKSGQSILARCIRRHSPWLLLQCIQLVFFGVVIVVLLRKLQSVEASLAHRKHYNEEDKSESLVPPLRYVKVLPRNDVWQDTSYTDLNFESGLAWKEMLHNQAFRISDEEMRRFNISTDPWNGVGLESGGYPSILGVFHNLHCLFHIKQELFREYYFATQIDWNAEERVAHTKHCLEVLRTSMLCKADLAPLPFLWDSVHNTSYVKASFDQECLVWDSLMEAVKNRQFAYDEIKHGH